MTSAPTTNDLAGRPSASAGSNVSLQTRIRLMLSLRSIPAARWVAAGAVLAGAAACGGDTESHAAVDLSPVQVQVTEVWTGSAAAVHPGRVVAVEEASVATRMAGTLDRVAVQVGDRVAAGALIAALSADDVNARIAGAEAQLELAQRTWTRVENLARDGAASAQERDQAMAALRGAEAQLQEAVSQAEYVEIRAPFAGVVTARMANPGDMAAPGHPIVRLAGTAVKVVAELPAEMAGQVAPGDAVQLTTAPGAAPMAGTVARVVPALDRGSRRFQIEVRPSSAAGLLPGAFARVHLEGSEDATRWIPADAIVRSGQLTGVYTLEQDTLRLRWLRLGRTDGEAVELLAGPAGALTVVRNPDGALRDGQPVSGVTTVAAPAETAGTAASREG
jgi:RND family efflux transporter MFP subunit